MFPNEENASRGKRAWSGTPLCPTMLSLPLKSNQLLQLLTGECNNEMFNRSLSKLMAYFVFEVSKGVQIFLDVNV